MLYSVYCEPLGLKLIDVGLINIISITDRQLYTNKKLFLDSCRPSIDSALSASRIGSITAFPIIETIANDITEYTATNIISITDGQLYSNKKLFLDSYRPAIDYQKYIVKLILQRHYF